MHSLFKASHTLNDYQSALEAYSTLEASGAYFIEASSQNGSCLISTPIACEVLFAMSRKIPIIFAGLPKFSTDIDPFSRDTICRRLNKIIIANINELDHDDQSSYLATIVNRKLNYVLTKHEETLIKSKLKSYFRELLKIQ